MKKNLIRSKNSEIYQLQTFFNFLSKINLFSDFQVATIH